MVAAPLGPRATGSDSRGERLNKLRILLLALAYACFWALFVLFPYPANVAARVPCLLRSQAPVFASNVVALVTMALIGRGARGASRRPGRAGGRQHGGRRRGPAPRCSPAAAALVASARCRSGPALDDGSPTPPSWRSTAWWSPLALAGASRRLSPRDNAVVLALSLLPVVPDRRGHRGAYGSPAHRGDLQTRSCPPWAVSSW